MNTRIFFILLLSLVVLPQLGMAKILPDCNPAVIPNKTGDNPCNLSKFAELVQNIIRYMTLIIFPIAAVAIGWGGFMILTSGGSGERMQSGKRAIKIAVIGVVILLVSYLLIQLIFKTLNVQTNFTDIPPAAGN